MPAMLPGFVDVCLNAVRPLAAGCKSFYKFSLQPAAQLMRRRRTGRTDVKANMGRGGVNPDEPTKPQLWAVDQREII
jgi:hypothetical protein